MTEHLQPTKKQKELFEFIREFIKEHDYSPSYREIMAALEYKSVSTVAVHVDGLITKGYLARGTTNARALMVKTESMKTSAQTEILAKLRTVENDEDRIVLEKALKILQKE